MKQGEKKEWRSFGPIQKCIFTHPAESHLVEKVLYKRCYAYVVEVTVDQQEFRQELKPGNCIVTVPHSLTTLPPHDAWDGHTRVTTGSKTQRRTIKLPTSGLRYMGCGSALPMPTWASCIILTSLAPSPTANVMGFSGEVFRSRTTWAWKGIFS